MQQKYKVRESCEDTKLVLVTGKLIDISEQLPEFKDARFFIHRSITHKNLWAVSEESTGLRIGDERKAQQKAIDCGIESLKNYGLELFKEAIEKHKIEGV